MKKLHTLSLMACLLSPGAWVQAQNVALTQPLQKIVDDYYKKYHEKEQFTAISAAVLVPDPKATSAHIQSFTTGTIGFKPFNQPITSNSLFDIGSITKSFTALMLLQLQAENKLRLDDALGKWLPQYKNWSKVTLRELLNMTSGIPNYSEDKKFDQTMYGDLGRTWSNEELLSYAHPEKPLPAHRRSLYEYCNSNYILAGMVIEKVTHDSFENQLKKRILQPGHLAKTYYPAGLNGNEIAQSLVKQRVHGYFFNDTTNKNEDTLTNNLSWAGAAGALVAPATDVVHWVQLLYHGLLIEPRYRSQALKELQSVVSLKTGQPLSTVSETDPAGFGLGVAYIYDKKTQQRFWFYEGSTLGFGTMYFWNPCNNVTVVAAINSKGGEGNPKTTMGDHIAELNSNLYQAIIEANPQLQCKK